MKEYDNAILKPEVITVRLQAEDGLMLVAIAKQEQMTKSEVVRRLLHAQLINYEMVYEPKYNGNTGPIVQHCRLKHQPTK